MTIDSTLIDSTLDAALEEFKGSGRIVIVGASLAGLRAAETLREEGFRGHLTIIGDEPYEPYDRPPLSKQVLKVVVPADRSSRKFAYQALRVHTAALFTRLRGSRILRTSR